jgi:hypothetical protein
MLHIGRHRRTPRRAPILTALTAVALVLSMHAAVSGAFASSHFTFVIDPSWSSQERAQLQTWLDPNGPVIKAVLQVAGPPPENLTITVVKERSGAAGDYDYIDHRIALSSLSLSVLVHELNHATRDRWLVRDAVWEEGLARAAEKEDMRLLAQQGITEPGYDFTHSYGYDEYYDQNNVATVGVPYGNIYAETALTLLRYEQAGYAFGKLLIENPEFVAKFNAGLFSRPNGSLSQSQLTAIAKAAQPIAEGLPFTSWRTNQRIFGTTQHEGCYLFQRVNQFTVDVYCTDVYGTVTAQAGVPVILTIFDSSKHAVFNETATTSSYGWASFDPSLNGTTGRIKLVANAESPLGTVRAMAYRQAGAEAGVFGVVANADTGTVSLRSPSAEFTPISVPVTRGAFAAPSLTGVRGQIIASFAGEGKTAQRTFDKDAAPYSLVFVARTP